MKRISIVLILVLLTVQGCTNVDSDKDKAAVYRYPKAKRVDVVDDYFGVKITDPYRWLEDADSKETISWVEKQNELTRQFLQTQTRGKIKNRLTELWDYPRYSVPRKEAGKYFFWKNDGLQPQPVLYVQQGLEGEPEALLNPNLFSKDGTVAVLTTEVSKNGRYLAYSTSEKGSDRQVVNIRDIETGRDLPEVIKWCRFPDFTWKKDSSGFFYTRFPEPNSVPPEDRTKHCKVYWHRLGSEQSQDELIYERPDEKELLFAPYVTEDGKYLILYVFNGTDPKNRLYYRPVDSRGPFVKLLDKADARYDFIANVGSVFYFSTDLKAPKGRVIAIDTEKPQEENRRQIIAESADVIENVTLADNRLVTLYMHDVHSLLKIFDIEGHFVEDIELPGPGAVNGIHAHQFDSEMFFSFTSFLVPTTIYRFDVDSKQLELYRDSELAFDASPYKTEQVFYRSKDGTKIPMFITHRKDLKLDGSNPTILYGYGGYNISLNPYFSVSMIPWYEQGGVYAVANIRGGNEYGEDWHQAGILGRKQNVFDDFIAAAEFLTDSGYTQRDKLAIMGGSNGGLLTSACMLQRPDLYGAVVSMVPVTDMLRYQKFTIGYYWIPEFGNAENSPEEFRFLYAYSPLHNVNDDIDYPAILVTTADTDDRVVPAHAKKFVATLQQKGSSKNPVLLRVETKAGHGHGKPTEKIIEEISDRYAFIFKIFKMEFH